MQYFQSFNLYATYTLLEINTLKKVTVFIKFKYNKAQLQVMKLSKIQGCRTHFMATHGTFKWKIGEFPLSLVVICTSS